MVGDAVATMSIRPCCAGIACKDCRESHPSGFDLRDSRLRDVATTPRLDPGRETLLPLSGYEAMDGGGCCVSGPRSDGAMSDAF